MKLQGNCRGFGINQDSGQIVLAYASFCIVVLAVAVFMSFSVNRVNVRIGDKAVSYLSFAVTVADVIREVGITGNTGLKRAPAAMIEGESIRYLAFSEKLSAPITDGMSIRIYRDRVRKSEENETLAPGLLREWDIFLGPGEERIIDSGQVGLLKKTFLTFWRDGALISKQEVGTKMVAASRPRVVASGSYELVSRQGVSFGGKPIRLMSTAYSFTGNHTAVGANTQRGIVAVDPNVVPLGTHMFIEGYGYAVAADTGGAIKGKRIDLFFENRVDATHWGRRPVNAYLLDKK